MSDLAIHETSIPGLLKIDLVMHGDNRGWFKENYQKQKLEALGLPKLEVVQNNISYNKEIGATRGIHAEPWNKFISMANGRVFVAFADFRSADSFGKTESFELSPNQAVYVPAGVGNSYQTLEPDTVYSYLVDDYWSPETEYTLVNLFDKDLAIPWPIPRERAIISDKDAGHPSFSDITPMEV